MQIGVNYFYPFLFIYLHGNYIYVNIAKQLNKQNHDTINKIRKSRLQSIS